MKKLTLFILISFLVSANLTMGQRGLLKKVAKSVSNDLIDRIDGSSDEEIQPEPSCACEQPELLFELGGKLQLNYNELNVSILDDGRILAIDTRSADYYIFKNGVAEGPYKAEDPRVAIFNPPVDDGTVESFIAKNKPYISKADDKLVINFDGKTYGPYAQIEDFILSKSKEEFVAVVIENIPFTEEFGSNLEEAMNNAKTQEEKIRISMQMAQEIQKNSFNNGVPVNMSPTLVSNIPGVPTEIQKLGGGTFDNTIKYDEIVLVAFDKIKDLQGNILFTLNPENVDKNDPLYLNSTNTRYATYRYGTLTFNDQSTMTDMFKTYLIKEGGKVYLAYLYYSPEKNSIMRCLIPF